MALRISKTYGLSVYTFQLTTLRETKTYAIRVYSFEKAKLRETKTYAIRVYSGGTSVTGQRFHTIMN